MEVISIKPARTITLGPTEVDVIDTLIMGVHFVLPRGSTLTYAAISPVDLGTPRTATRITLYRKEDENTTKFAFQLVPIGYAWAQVWRVATVWQGRMQLDDDHEHELSMYAYNQTGATVRWQSMAVVEVE